MSKIGIERDLFDDLVRFLEGDFSDEENEVDASELLTRCYKAQDELKEDNAEIDDCIVDHALQEIEDYDSPDLTDVVREYQEGSEGQVN